MSDQPKDLMSGEERWALKQTYKAAPAEPLKLDVSKEWCERMARKEPDVDITVGVEVPAEPLTDLAKRIAARLFTNGFGQHADNLRMLIGNPWQAAQDLGGWCESAVADQIEAELRAAHATQQALIEEWRRAADADLDPNNGDDYGIKVGTRRCAADLARLIGAETPEKR